MVRIHLRALRFIRLKVEHFSLEFSRIMTHGTRTNQRFAALHFDGHLVYGKL